MNRWVLSLHLLVRKTEFIVRGIIRIRTPVGCVETIWVTHKNSFMQRLVGLRVRCWLLGSYNFTREDVDFLLHFLNTLPTIVNLQGVFHVGGK
jgi:hypothetical protein